jgi:ketosteroid isomerase-like protein
MRPEFLLLAGVFAAGEAHGEALRREACRRGDEERIIEIAAPGAIGLACDVVYIRDGGARLNIPYHANVDADYCRARAAELASTLEQDGFTCAPALEDFEPAVVSVERSAARSDSASAPRDPTAAAAESPLGVESAATSDPLADIEPPTLLAGEAKPILHQAPPPATRTRITGAAPVEEASVAAPTMAVATPMPAPQERILAMLAAAVAAWNDGDLDAYLSFYSGRADVALVRESIVTATAREIRAAFAGGATGAELGRMSLDVLDVAVTGVGHAVVVGRYARESAGAFEEGAITLLLEENEGVWRIVRDSRAATSAPTD